MNSISEWLIVCLSLFLGAPLGAEESEVLLLNNGQVISGKVKKQDGGYVVVKKSGSRIVFPSSRVVLVCSDWEDLYWEKCALLRATDVVGHRELFHWCIQHRLVESAQNQIDLLQNMEVSATQLHRLDQKLQEIRLAIAKALRREAELLVKKAEALASGKRDYKVKQVGFDEETTGSVKKGPVNFPVDKKVAIPARANELSKDVDPFDPEVFNEKYVRNRATKQETEAKKSEADDL